MTDRRGYTLIYLALSLSLVHHLDHAVRGNHVGWPLIADVTPFTYSLGIYPFVVAGLVLSHAGRVGPGYWTLLSGFGIVFLSAIHFGPTAVEPPRDIIDLYQAPSVGWLAFAVLLLLVGVLGATFVHELRLWRSSRRRVATRSDQAS